MTKAGDRILAGAREALAHARGEDVPGLKVHPGSASMERDWSAEAAAVDRENAEAKAAMDKARQTVRTNARDGIARTEDLDAFGKAEQRFRQARDRRSVFHEERAAHDDQQ